MIKMVVVFDGGNDTDNDGCEDDDDYIAGDDGSDNDGDGASQNTS